MLQALVLLALHFSWPPHVEQSTQAGCQLMQSAADNPSPQLTHQWLAYGYVRWAGMGPDGDDIVAKQLLYSTDNRRKALMACNDYLEAYDKLMRIHVRGSKE